MSCDENPDVCALEKAVANNDLNNVRKLLDEGVDPNFIDRFSWMRLSELTPDRTRTDIIKLLIDQPKFNVNDDLIIDFMLYYVLNPDTTQYVEELVAHIVNRDNNVQLMQKIFHKLMQRYDDSPRLLEFLLDHGLPVDDFIRAILIDGMTPLHVAIMENKAESVSLLLQRGANVNKKTKDKWKRSPLDLATMHWWVCNESIVELLLKNGANVNEKSDFSGMTPLHCVSDYLKPLGNLLFTLLDYGADVNALNNNLNTPLTAANRIDTKHILTQEMAKLKFMGHTICSINLNYLQQNEDLQKIFNDCLKELERMKNCKFYNNFTLFDILQMGRQRMKKLTMLTKNENFVDAFHSAKESVKFYVRDLDVTFGKAVEKRDTLVLEERKLKSIFKSLNLPDLIVKKLAYFENEHLFFK